jgi:class 3 adenylate cyclase/tetratricopeptide (TPR) repeat protein
MCGEQNPDKAKFCLECAAPLASAAPAREERRVVTVLFADLVGFTARSEAMDVEDVRGTLVPYHQLLRRELERHGGTVEKFIGDAVMALFGAPVAHEDDPERAVRAALSIQAAVAVLREEEARLDLHVRIGVDTGEALVALDANPQAGEGMASGDVVNTAARLQSAAPVDGVLVGEVTYRATSRAIEYEEAAPVHAKGKTEPVRAWVAKQARSRLGSDVQHVPSTPLVGRERQLELLWAAFEQAREERSPQLVTLIGVPGIGKSRLVWELFQRVEADPDLTTWRQGRSLPYGEGVAFWALGEMVKAHAGVLHSDSAEASGGKLGRAVGDLIDKEADAQWVEGHLRPLLGLETGQQPSADRQAEAFAAWRRFVEALAERRPTVLVFEDLHWADDALLDFIDHLVEWASGVPLLVLCTARPELLERRNGWGGGKANAILVSLSPLSERDTARLVAALLEQAALPSETQSALLERAEGNPLYAEEYVRMLIDRGVLVRHGSTWRLAEGVAVPLPESVQGIIAARLDALPAAEKALLQAASVLGKVVWLRAVEHVGGVSRWQVEERLHRLERKEFVRRERQSSVEGEMEYAFRHILVRDVAYGQIPRAERAVKHQKAAEWVESLSGERADRVEMLAHHYWTALDLARTTGQPAAPTLERRARLALREAGDHALALNSFAAALRYYRSALALWPRDDHEYGSVLLGVGKARLYAEAGLPGELVTAADRLQVDGASVEAAEALSLASARLGSLNVDWEAQEALAQRALLILQETTSPPKLLARVLQTAAFSALGQGRHEDGAHYAWRAAEIAERHGNSEELIDVATTLGVVECAAGREAEGRAQFDRALAAAIPLTTARAVGAHANVAHFMYVLGELPRSRELGVEGVRRARELGLPFWIDALTSELIRAWYDTGEWAKAATSADALIGEIDAGREYGEDVEVRHVRARIYAAHGQLDSAVEQATKSLAAARAGQQVQYLLPALSLTAWVSHVAGDASGARAAADDLLAAWPNAFPFQGSWALGQAALAFAALGLRRQFIERAANAPIQTPWLQAAIALCEERYHDAATIYNPMTAFPDEAYARLKAGKQLIEADRPAEGEPQLERSLAFWLRVDAKATIRECQALLAHAETA